MLALDSYQELDRPMALQTVYALNAMGVKLALDNGHIAIAVDQPPLSEEARELLREHKQALLAYLTTPPDDTRPCYACGRLHQWELDEVGIWVCTCKAHPEYLTPAGPAPSTEPVSLSDYWQSPAGPASNGQADSPDSARTPERDQHTAARETVTSRGCDQCDQQAPDEEEMIGIGVLTADQLYSWRPGAQAIECHDLTSPARDLRGFYRLACQYKLHSLWVCPGNPVCLAYKDQPELFAPADLADGYKVNVRHKEKSNLPTSATIYPTSGPRGHRPMLHVYLPDFDSTWLEDLDEKEQSWSLSDVEEPRLFLETLILIYERLGVYLDTSPARTGIESMRAFTRPGDWSHTEAEIHLPHFAELDIHWKRELASDETGLYLHKFDANSKYLASTTGADKGTGTPDHLGETEAASAFSAGAMGMWEVTLKEPARWPVIDGVDTARLPHNPNWPGKRWLTSPGLKSYQAMGYEWEIHQGYQWQNVKGRADIGKRRALKEWASSLFKVRQALKAEYGPEHPAYKLIKMIANRSLGWLDLEKVRERIAKGCVLKDVPWYYAPYYYQEIKGLSRFRMVLKMQELARAGHYPVLIFTDCFGFLSPEPDARAAFPQLLERESDLGGFKHAGTIQVTADVIAAFSQEQASETLHWLKLLEREAR